MREAPADLAVPELLAALRAGWAVRSGTAEFLPVGAGSFHWAVADRFVKVDDLGFDGPDAAFDRLRRSLETALALRLDFVLAPIPAAGGEVVRRLTDRYAVSVFPLLHGVSGEFAPHPPADRPAVVDMLAALHRTAVPVAPHADLLLPGRDRLEAVLRETGRPWDNGPYAEPARRVLAEHASKVEDWLAHFDRLAAIVGADRTGWVVTHGEPHPGNFLRTATGTLLIDWDTVRVAPPERDLWMLTAGFADMLGVEAAGDDEAVLGRYRELTGHTISADALALYRRWWELADVAVYAGELRRPHRESADLAASLTYLTGYLQS
ncbi:phosphotransferase [Actinoplanes aureus]|uniref:phosphotransferase n=1 Tax=Actinoplanes aureus TaxID=2792083 RepID=UPI001E32CBA2|nr:phosphotransferase [Actinoplanes aureus]